MIPAECGRLSDSHHTTIRTSAPWRRQKILDELSPSRKEFGYFRIRRHPPAIGSNLHGGPSKPRSHAFVALIAARFLVLKIHSELDYAGVEILDRLTKSAKTNRACAEKRIDCGSACMVKEVKDLCD